MNKLLKITLQSDLCAAVGKHYAAIIDLDTALDEYGIPYIPSKRLKGCMREIAEYIIEDNEINKIFGATGQMDSGSLHISNAEIEDYENIVYSIIKKSNIPAEKVAEYYCSVRGETAIENDTAKENSLRYIRVVNQCEKLSGKPLEFFAKISFDDNDFESVLKIVKCLRNIGYHRNRGLGAVKCELIDDTNAINLHLDNVADNKEYKISFTVKTVGDLMLPKNDANHSDDFISGTMLQGSLAGKYIKKFGEKDFIDIFLSEDVVFGNLYPAFRNYNGKEYQYFGTYPAPKFMAKIKAATTDEDKGIKNTIGKHGNGKQYKILKTGYVNETYGYTKPEGKIVYHNSNVKNENQLLYMQYCIAEGQYFSGSICGTGNKINIIKDLLTDGVLYFGRSKTAQYARCEIVDIKIEPCNKNQITLNAGTIAAFVLESDVALLGRNGVFTTDISELCSALNIDVSTLREESVITSKTIGGYNAKWNMKKPQISLISAGSCLVFEVKENILVDEYQIIGEKANEGFGKIRAIADADKFSLGNKDIRLADINVDCLFVDNNDIIRSDAINIASKINLNTSQIGRLILMAKESTDYNNFRNRINSIKTKDFHDKAVKLFDESDKEWEDAKNHIITALTVRKYQLKGGNK